MGNKVLVVLSLGCLSLMGCAGGESEKEVVHHVMCVRPLSSGGEYVKSFSGVVKEAREISLGFKTAGQIERIHVKEGDFVREGQLVAELDDADYRLGVEALQIQAGQLEDEVRRMKQLYEAKSISDNDYEKAVAGLRQLKVQLQLNRNKLDYTRLHAPVAGYIQSVNFEPAEMVDAGTPVFSLLDTKRMEVELDIPVEVYRQKDSISGIFCESGKERKVPMTLVSVTPKADGTQLYRMCLAFGGNVSGKLTAGMSVGVDILLASGGEKGKFTLPVHAVFKEKENVYVWTVDADSVVHKRQVVLDGMDEKGHAVISSGLKGDEQVVRAGVNALQENEKVGVMAEPEKTNVGGLL